MKALIFDLDGTLVDSVYPHTLAWRTALLEFGLPSPAWAIHRRIGMSGKLLVKAVARDHNRTLSDADIERLTERHASVFRQLSSTCIPFAGAVDLLGHLAEYKIPHGIATSGTHEDIEPFFKKARLAFNSGRGECRHGARWKTRAGLVCDLPAPIGGGPGMIALSWEMPSGISMQHAAPESFQSACSPGVSASRNCITPARCECIVTYKRFIKP